MGTVEPDKPMRGTQSEEQASRQSDRQTDSGTDRRTDRQAIAVEQ